MPCSRSPGVALVWGPWLGGLLALTTMPALSIAALTMPALAEEPTPGPSVVPPPAKEDPAWRATVELYGFAPLRTTGTATTDTNTLWCNFGVKGTQSLGTLSCPSGGSCGVEY